LVARAIFKIRDTPPLAALVATYLTGAPASDLRVLALEVDVELQGQLQWLLDTERVEIETRLQSSGVQALIAVAAAGRAASGREELLTLAEASDDEAVSFVARRVALRQVG